MFFFLSQLPNATWKFWKTTFLQNKDHMNFSWPPGDASRKTVASSSLDLIFRSMVAYLMTKTLFFHKNWQNSQVGDHDFKEIWKVAFLQNKDHMIFLWPRDNASRKTVATSSLDLIFRSTDAHFMAKILFFYRNWQISQVNDSEFKEIWKVAFLQNKEHMIFLWPRDNASRKTVATSSLDLIFWSTVAHFIT